MTEQTFTARNNILSGIEGEAVRSHAKVIDLINSVWHIHSNVSAAAAALNGFGMMAGKTLTSGEISQFHQHIGDIREAVKPIPDDSQAAEDVAEIGRCLRALADIIPNPRVAEPV